MNNRAELAKNLQNFDKQDEIFQKTYVSTLFQSGKADLGRVFKSFLMLDEEVKKETLSAICSLKKSVPIKVIDFIYESAETVKNPTLSTDLFGFMEYLEAVD